MHVWVQLAKLMEEGEAKKERDEEYKELQEVSHELQAQMQALKEGLADARSLSASLQQEARLARCFVTPASAAVMTYAVAFTVVIAAVLMAVHLLLLLLLLLLLQY